MADKKTEVTSNAGAPESEKVSTGSGVSSESTVDSSDYEVVASGQEVRSQPASCSSGSRNSDEVQKQLEESMEDEGNGSGDVSKVTDQLEKSLNLTNENVDEEDDGDEGTGFDSIIYLGRHPIKDPKNEADIHAQIRENNALYDLGSGREACKAVKVQVPVNAEGTVNVVPGADTNDKQVLSIPVNRIIFFARGAINTNEASCFAFTVASQEQDQTTGAVVFQSFLFKCQSDSVVADVYQAFAHAFKKPPSLTEAFYFEVSLEIRENQDLNQDQGTQPGGHESSAAANYDSVPRQKNMFKLKKDVDKKVVITVSQISKNNSVNLNVERCFGLLVSPGRNARHADMQLLEHVTMATSASIPVTAQSMSGEASNEQVLNHVITGHWDPREAAFAVLNQETPHDVSSTYITIAADLVVSQIAEPIRFVIETKARIYPKTERYWYYTRKSLVRQYRVTLKRRPTPGRPRPSPSEASTPDAATNPAEAKNKIFDLESMEISEEIEQPAKGGQSRKSMGLQLVSQFIQGSLKSPPVGGGGHEIPSPTLTLNDEGEDSDNGEPLLSGFGEVSKECSGNELEMWSQMLQDWDKLTDQHPQKNSALSYPKTLLALNRTVGVPEALRGEVWQRFTGASSQQEEIVETYRILITKESPDDKVILRDIHRTFPAHDFFKDSGGAGQESLYRIAKAYSVYDSEIGYCQGQSFLIAALLLQMPEEQTFGVLVKVMHQLGLRDMFRENFEHLQMRLFQLDRLIENYLPDIWAHFAEYGIESHMYASQWFLTVFTAKFPLYLVFRVLDVFLLEGFESIFQVALALLKVARKDLLQQDFEGLMKFFRVNIPKTYRNEENARHLMGVAVQIKLKKLKKYEREWMSIKAAERAREDPLLRLERDNKRLVNENMRLDTENDNLARELVNSKIEMRREIDAMEDSKDSFEKELEGCKSLLHEAVEERKRLEGETEQLKQLVRQYDTEIATKDTEMATKNNVIEEYKTICSQLSSKLEKAQKANSGSGTAPPSSLVSTDSAIEDSAFDAVTKLLKKEKEDLEIELAKTKLALVETECKNQDLTHQLSVVNDASSNSQQQGNKTWFSGKSIFNSANRTLSSIRESAASAASGPNAGSNMVRSMSVQTGASNVAGPTLGNSKQSMSKSSSVDNIRD